MHNLLFPLTTATIIQAQFKGYYQRKKYVTMRLATIVIAKHWKRVLAKRLLERRRKAAHRIRKYAICVLLYFSQLEVLVELLTLLLLYRSHVVSFILKGLSRDS